MLLDTTIIVVTTQQKRWQTHGKDATILTLPKKYIAVNFILRTWYRSGTLCCRRGTEEQNCNGAKKVATGHKGLEIQEGQSVTKLQE
jgi:hypothetical protein